MKLTRRQLIRSAAAGGAALAVGGVLAPTRAAAQVEPYAPLQSSPFKVLEIYLAGGL